MKHLGARDYGVKGAAGFYRHRIILRMQKMVGEHPSFFHDCCVDFLKGDVSVLEDSMERFAAFWSSSAFDDLRDGGDKAADVLEHAIQRAADQIESDDNQLLKPSDVRVLVAEPKFSEFLVGRCTHKLKRAHWEEVQERCDAAAIKYQPSLSELHTAAADCLMIVTLEPVAVACINTAYADAPTAAGLDLDAPVLDHFFEINSTKWMQHQCKGTSLDLVTKMAAEGKGFNQHELIATVNGVSKLAMTGFHSELQHTLFLRAYASLSSSKSIPSPKKLFDEYNEELQLEADIMAGGGYISCPETFIRDHRVTLHDITSYKKTFIASAQAKLNAANACAENPERLTLWDKINSQIEKTHIGAIQKIQPKHQNTTAPVAMVQLVDVEPDVAADAEPADVEHADVEPADVEHDVEPQAADVQLSGAAGVGSDDLVIVESAGDSGGDAKVCFECLVASATVALSKTVFDLTDDIVAAHGVSLTNLPRRECGNHTTYTPASRKICACGHNRKQCQNSLKDNPSSYVGDMTAAQKTAHKTKITLQVRKICKHLGRKLGLSK